MMRFEEPGRLGGVLFIVALLVGSACSGAPGAPLATQPAVPGVTPTPDGVEPTRPPTVPGGWSGTITFHLVRDIDTTETSTSGEGFTRSTITTHFEHKTDVTDIFTVTGNDPDPDPDYGISGSVDLTGLVANNGTTLVRTVIVEDKHNALGCHYLAETGSEIDGSWTMAGTAEGEINVNIDGTYDISIRGGEPGEDEIPQLHWEAFTTLEGAAIDCPPPGRSEITGFGQYGEWAHGGGAMEGTLDPQNPGSVLDGSNSVEIDSPEAVTITVTWHLVHDGPIALPQY